MAGRPCCCRGANAVLPDLQLHRLAAAVPSFSKAQTAGCCSSHCSFWLCSGGQWRLPKHRWPSQFAAIPTHLLLLMFVQCSAFMQLWAVEAATAQAAAMVSHDLPELVAGCWRSGASRLAAASSAGCQCENSHQHTP